MAIFLESFPSSNCVISSNDQILLPGTVFSAEYHRLRAASGLEMACHCRGTIRTPESQIYLYAVVGAVRAVLRRSVGAAAVMRRRVAIMLVDLAEPGVDGFGTRGNSAIVSMDRQKETLQSGIFGGTYRV